MPTKIEIIYEKLKEELETIKDTYSYKDLSQSFGHFMLKNIYNISDQDASENITDGFGDNGIDAIYIENENIVNFFQFKFPNNFKNVSKGFSDEEIVKLESGVNEFITQKVLDSARWNGVILDKHKEVQSLSAFSIKFILIRFTNSQVGNLENKLEIICKNIKEQTLNDCNYEFYTAVNITEIYDSKYERKYPNIELISYNNQVQSYEGENYKSKNVVCSIEELYYSIDEKRNKIFEGNVRYHNPRSEITKGIRNTLSNFPEKFIIFNNGITILAKKSDYNMSKLKHTLTSASIINGAQTVGTILAVCDEEIEKVGNLDKYKNSTILIRILEIDKEDELITEVVNSLNTQTKMFSAYNISNDIRLKDIQKAINKNEEIPYFLEIKDNEYTKEKKLENTKKYKKDLINSETLIQLYVGFYNIHGKSHISKSHKSELLNDDSLIDKVLSNMRYDETIEIINLYQEILKVIKMFRSYKNSSNKIDILKYLDINKEKISSYQFLTTGDILILYVVGILTNKEIKELNNENNINNYIKKAIELIRKYIEEILTDSMPVLSNITKDKTTFAKLKELYDELKERRID